MRELVAGIDLGGTNIKAALADLSGNVMIEDSIPTDSYHGPDDVIQRIGSLVSTLSAQSEGKIASVGVGVPGLVDVAKGTTRFLPNMPTKWRNVPVADKLGSMLNAPVRLLNDVRSATLGELRFGHGKGDPELTMVFFALGTGVGGGIVVNGRLRQGIFGAAGELGHLTIHPDGPRCGCGNRGCLETLSSGNAIAAEGVRLMRMGLAPRLHEKVNGCADQVTTREMFEVAQDDELVMEALVNAAGYVGLAAVNVVTILHPELIVLGGGVAAIGDVLTDNVKRTIQERVCMFPTDNIRVELSQLGDQAGVKGTIALALQEFE